MFSGRKFAAAVAAAFALTMFSVQAVQAATPAGDGRATPVAPVRDRAAVPARAAAQDGPYWMFNANSGKCLTVQNVSTANNARTLQYTCENTAPFNEDWFLQLNDDGSYKIVNSNSGKCLTVLAASVASGAAAVQFTCDDVAPFNDRWEFVDLSPHPADHWYHVRNVHSGLCLTVQGASRANNAFAIQYPCDDRIAPYNEEWQLF